MLVKTGGMNLMQAKIPWFILARKRAKKCKVRSAERALIILGTFFFNIIQGLSLWRKKTPHRFVPHGHPQGCSQGCSVIYFHRTRVSSPSQSSIRNCLKSTGAPTSLRILGPRRATLYVRRSNFATIELHPSKLRRRRGPVRLK